MNTKNFAETMKIFTDRLGVTVVDFEFKNDRFISTDTIVLDEDDPMEYLIVVKVINNVGTVVIGYSDGIKFTETETLGQIICENDTWNIV